MANEGNVSWTQRTGKIGPAVYVTSKGGGIDFVGTATSMAANGAYPVDGILTIINSNPYSDGISNRYRFYSTNPPTPAPTPSPTPTPPTMGGEKKRGGGGSDFGYRNYGTLTFTSGGLE